VKGRCLRLELLCDEITIAKSLLVVLTDIRKKVIPVKYA
jgi:hypothetical protein